MTQPNRIPLRGLAWVFAMALIWLVLIYLVAPAAQTVQGMDFVAPRYGMAKDSVYSFWRIADVSRAPLLMSQLPYVLVVWLPLGTIGLWIAMRFQYTSWAPTTVVALASIAAAACEALGMTAQTWLLIAVVACVVLLIQWKTAKPSQQLPNKVVIPMAAMAIWSMYLVLIVIGVIWLADIAARGPVELRFVAVHQLDAIWISAMLVVPLVAWATPRLLRVPAQISVFWDAPRGPIVLSVGFWLTLVALVWIGSRASTGHQSGYPHVSAELVRLMTSLALAWLMARYYEWGTGIARWARSVPLILTVFSGGLAVLILTRDLGPVLSMFLGLVPLLLVALIPRTQTGIGAIKIIGFAMLWIGLALLTQFVLSEWLPQQSWAPERIVMRHEAMVDPFGARLDYGSQIAWILDAAGAGGFGIGSVPWCGARAFIGQAACTKSSGVPVQFASDYVHTGITAVWGPVGAVGLLTLSIALIALVVWFVVRQPLQDGPKLTAMRIHAWLVVVMAAMLLGQLFVTVTGNLRLIPLTGVTQPFLGLGSTSLLMTGAWIGLALGSGVRISQPSTWLSDALQRYFWGILIGSVLFIGVAVGLWFSTTPPAVSDKLQPKLVVQGLKILVPSVQSEVAKPSSAAPNATGKTILVEPGLSCQINSERVSSLLAKLTAHTGLEFALVNLPCEQAIAVASAANWALTKSAADATRQLKVFHGASIGVANPYRLSGCIQSAQDPGESTARCPDTPESINQLLADSPRLRQALRATTSALRRAGEQTQTSFYESTPKRALASDLPVPTWAAHLGVDHLVRPIFAMREPLFTRFGQGEDVTLSIEPALQTQVQEFVRCYVGPCKVLSSEATGANGMLEGARARMASTLVVDVPTGRIEAAASAHTPCYQAHHEGKVLTGCMAMPQPAELRPWKTTNQALHGEAMCGSLCKIEQALALLRSGSPLTRDPQSFAKAIRESQTERFIDAFMCEDKAFDPSCIQSRLRSLVNSTRDLGGASLCLPGDRACRYLNVLAASDRANLMLARQSLLMGPGIDGRSLVDVHPPGAGAFPQNAVSDCYANGLPKRWRGCRGEGLVAHVAELFGQGNAITSPAGVAQALVTIANAAQAGLSPAQANSPTVTLMMPQAKTSSASTNHVAPEHAAKILQALQEPLKPGGTAHLSCLKAITGDQTMNCDNTGDWVIAGKTGTPLFPHDTLTFTERKAQCDKLRHMPPTTAQRHQVARCQVAPIKWFAFLLGQRDGARVKWSKAIVVLAERNWNARTGLVDTPLDRGGNVAAELGLRVARAIAEATESTQQMEDKHAYNH